LFFSSSITKGQQLEDLISSHIALTSNIELMAILEEKQSRVIAHFDEYKIKISREGAL
jgi:hypothetical protein